MEDTSQVVFKWHFMLSSCEDPVVSDWINIQIKSRLTQIVKIIHVHVEYK